MLAALVEPALFTLDGTVAGLLDASAAAGGLAPVVAWRTGCMLSTVAVGLAVLWVAGSLLG